MLSLVTKTTPIKFTDNVAYLQNDKTYSKFPFIASFLNSAWENILLSNGHPFS